MPGGEATDGDTALVRCAEDDGRSALPDLIAQALTAAFREAVIGSDPGARDTARPLPELPAQNAPSARVLARAPRGPLPDRRRPGGEATDGDTALVRWAEDGGRSALPDLMAQALTAAFGEAVIGSDLGDRDIRSAAP
ncbi:hypothetical protein [Streptomyces sp. NPDC054866]